MLELEWRLKPRTIKLGLAVGMTKLLFYKITKTPPSMNIISKFQSPDLPRPVLPTCKQPIQSRVEPGQR